MPPKRKTRGKKRSRLSSAARGAKRRVRSAARYARRNPGRIAGGALGLGALGLGAYEGYAKYKRSQGDESYYSPTRIAFRRSQGAGSRFLDRIMPSRNKKRQKASTTIQAVIRGILARKRTARGDYDTELGMDELEEAVRQAVAKEDVRQAEEEVMQKNKDYGDIVMRKREQARIRRANKDYGDMMMRQREKANIRRAARAERLADDSRMTELRRMAAIETEGRMKYGKRRRRKRRKFGDNCSTHKKPAYGKRRKRKSSFGKKVKKPSAATKRMCKKLKVRLTVKRGKKRVYKSEKVLKKQCKTAMKRKKKKSKK